VFKHLLLIFFVCVFGVLAAAQKPSEKVKPLTIGFADELYSRALGEERVVNIYLPDGYKSNDTAKYPVIYLLDGGMDEDFIHVTGIVQFDTFPWVARIPSSIVVGIVNVDRRRDFTFPTTLDAERKRNPTSGHSDKFIAFLKDELQPFIEKKYRGSSSRTLIGESLGGLLATEILFEQPLLFDKYIIVSPSIWWDNGSLLKGSTDALRDRKTPMDVYIGVGKEGLAPTEAPHVGEVDANLLAEKLTKIGNKELRVSFDYLPNENHATIAHQAIFNAFRMLYPPAKAEQSRQGTNHGRADEYFHLAKSWRSASYGQPHLLSFIHRTCCSRVSGGVCR